MRTVEVKSYDVLKFGNDVHGVQIIVPASVGRTAVHLEIDHEGKLCISGGSSIIGEIIGPGMIQKIKKT